MTGVSVQTVSRVINKRPDVSPETRAVGRGRHRAARVPAQRRRAQPRPAPQPDDRRHRRGPQVLRRGADPQRRRRGGRGLGLLDHPQGAGELRRPGHRAGRRVLPRPSRRGDHLRAAADGREHPPRDGPAARSTARRSCSSRRSRPTTFTTIGIDNAGRRAARHRAPARARAARGSRTSRARSSGARPGIAATAGWPRIEDAGLEPGPMTTVVLVVGGRRRRLRPAPRRGPDDRRAVLRQRPDRARRAPRRQRARDPDPRAARGRRLRRAARGRASSRPSLTTVRQPLAELGKLAVHELVAAVDAEAGAYTPRADPAARSS